MSKKNNTQSIEIPAIYADLTTPDKKSSTRKVIIATDRSIHSFLSHEVPVPPELSIDMEFKDFDDLSKRQPQVILALHSEFLRAEPPKKQSIMTSALYTWAYFLKHAKGHLAGTSISGEKERKSSMSGRIYSRGTEYDKAPLPKLPSQAMSCLAIFTNAIGKDLGITEEVLKAAVMKNAADLKTKQDPWRIFQYYRPKLIALKLIKHD